MNQEQIAKLKALAQAAEKDVIRSHGWAGSVEMLETLRIDEEYLTSASPAAILELIALAEKAFQPTSEQNARFAIDGAMWKGHENVDPPPTEDHWLMPYWKMARDLAEFKATAERTTVPVTTPDTSQDWAKLDGAQAFHLIERHADGWAETGNMMESWLAARMVAAPVSLTDDDLTQEFSLDAIIKGIRYADHGRHEGWEAELKEYIRIECNRTLLAAAPAPIQQEPASSMWYVRQLRYEKRADGGEDLVSEVYKEGQGEERIEVRTQKPAPQSHQFACMLAQALTAWEGNERQQFTIEEINLFRQWFDNVEDLNQQYLELADYDLAKKLYPLCGCRWSDRSEEHRKKLLNQSMR